MRNTIKRVDALDGISDVVDIVHDCWFDIEKLNFDSDASVLSIPFEKEVIDETGALKAFLFLKKKQIRIVQYVLKILKVQEYTITDDAKIGRYDFNEIKFNKDLNQLVITSGFPMAITLTVRALDVEVVCTNEVLGNKETLTI